MSSTPTTITANPIGACAVASGNQVWNGTSGALIANAVKNPRKIHTCTPSGAPDRIGTSFAQSNVPWPVTCAA